MTSCHLPFAISDNHSDINCSSHLLKASPEWINCPIQSNGQNMKSWCTEVLSLPQYLCWSHGAHMHIFYVGKLIVSSIAVSITNWLQNCNQLLNWYCYMCYAHNQFTDIEACSNEPLPHQNFLCSPEVLTLHKLYPIVMYQMIYRVDDYQ